jgi:hypothetical protein
MLGLLFWQLLVELLSLELTASLLHLFSAGLQVDFNWRDEFAYECYLTPSTIKRYHVILTLSVLSLLGNGLLPWMG